jgi:hypothetical protein
LHKSQLVRNRLIYFGLDGTHHSSDATILTRRAIKNCYFTWLPAFARNSFDAG